MKKRMILSSIMMIVLCVTLISGATFALFTSESKTNITIQSGKVNVTSEIESYKLYSMEVEQTGDQFENGGTAELVDNQFKLINVTPGDKVVAQIKIDNNSNVKIRYRVSFVVEGELAAGLVASAKPLVEDGTVFNLGEWYEVEAETDIPNLEVSFELPLDAGNEYQDKSAEAYILVEAIQANGFLNNYVTPLTIDVALANAQEGDEIELAAGYYDEIVVPVNGIKLYSVEGAEVGFLNINGKADITLQGLTFDAANAQAVSDAYKGGTVRTYASIAGAVSTANSVGARNLVIDGCVFTGRFENSGAAIAFADRSRPTGGAGAITIKNCKFETTNSNYDIYGYYTGNPNLGFVIENNEFASKCIGRPIYLGRLKTNESVVVKGNTFKNVDALESAVYVQGDSGYTPSIDAAENTFGSLIDYVTPSTIGSALASAQEGAVIELAAGYYDEIVVPGNGIKLYSVEGAEVGFLNVNGKANITLQGLTFDAANAKMVSDGKGNAKQNASIAGASGKSTGIGARGLVVDGCTFAGEFANGGVAIAFVDQSRTSGQSGNITVKNCKFANKNAYYDIYCHYSGYGELVIENNEFASDCLGLPVYLGRYQSSTPVVVKDNTFKNVDSLENAVYIQAHSTAYNVSIDASGNILG